MNNATSGKLDSNYSKRSYLLVAALATAVALCIALFWGIPVPKAAELQGVYSLVAGSYSPKDRILVPTKVITNFVEVSGYVEGLAVAPQRLVLPTLGTLRGPVVLLDQQGDPIAAAFYQAEHKALILYNVRKADGVFHVMNEKLEFGGAFQRAFKYNLFDEASGKWQTRDWQTRDTQKTNSRRSD